MSNIGKRPVQLGEGVQVALEGKKISVTGPKGTLSVRMPRGVTVEVQDSTATVKKITTENVENFYGLTRALLANMVTGVTKGFEKKLELSGVGYRAKVEGRELVLNVGFANQIRIAPPEGVSFQVQDNVITVSGINKELVGNTASKVREVRPPDPYKAKGIRYVGEIIRKKAGKSAKAGAK